MNTPLKYLSGVFCCVPYVLDILVRQVLFLRIMWPFIDKNRSTKFRNASPLYLKAINEEECLMLDFEAFPTIDDFRIKVQPVERFRLLLYFHSPTQGSLASFPYWDNVIRDLLQYTAKDIFLGDLEEPFSDGEQGWEIVIFENEDYVYILQGNGEVSCEFNTWFRVSREKYIAEWMKAIGLFNPNV